MVIPPFVACRAVSVVIPYPYPHNNPVEWRRPRANMQQFCSKMHLWTICDICDMFVRSMFLGSCICEMLLKRNQLPLLVTHTKGNRSFPVFPHLLCSTVQYLGHDYTGHILCTATASGGLVMEWYSVTTHCAGTHQARYEIMWIWVKRDTFIDLLTIDWCTAAVGPIYTTLHSKVWTPILEETANLSRPPWVTLLWLQPEVASQHPQLLKFNPWKGYQRLNCSTDSKPDSL